MALKLVLTGFKQVFRVATRTKLCQNRSSGLKRWRAEFSPSSNILNVFILQIYHFHALPYCNLLCTYTRKKLSPCYLSIRCSRFMDEDMTLEPCHRGSFL